MKLRRRCGRALALALLGLPVLAPAALAAEAGDAIGKVTATFRRVQVLPLGRGRTWNTLEKGDQVRLGDVVRTGPRGRARIELLDRIDAKNAGPTVVNIGSATEVGMEHFLPRKDKVRTEGVLDLIRGTIRAFTKGFSGQAAFSVRVGTSLCGIRGSEVQVFAGIPRASALGATPFRGGGPSSQGRPANVSCFSGDCFAFPMPQGGSGSGFPGMPRPGTPGVWSIDPMNQLVMGNSNDPSTWRQVPLTPQRQEDLLNQSGVPGVSQGVSENQIFQDTFGSGGGTTPGPTGGRASLPPSQLGGGPNLPLPPGGHGGAASNRFANHGVHGGGTLPQGTSFHAVSDDDTDQVSDDDTDQVGGQVLGDVPLFADGFVDSRQAAGWSGQVTDITQYQAGLRTLQLLGQAIVDGNLKAFMDSFSPNATQDTSIFRNGFLDDLQEDQNSTVNLDFEVFEYRLAGTAWSGGTLIVRLRWLLTINGTQVQTGSARILFDRDSGFRIIAWLGNAPFGRNDPQTQAQTAAGDPNVESGPITGSGSFALTNTGVAGTHQTALVLDAETNSTQIFTNTGFPRESAIDSGASLTADIAIDVVSAFSGFATLGDLDFITGGLRSGALGLLECLGSPSISSIGLVDTGAVFDNRQFLPAPFPTPGSITRTFGFSTEEGRWGVIEITVSVSAVPPPFPEDVTINYNFKLGRDVGETTIDPSASGVCAN